MAYIQSNLKLLEPYLRQRLAMIICPYKCFNVSRLTGMSTKFVTEATKNKQEYRVK